MAVNEYDTWLWERHGPRVILRIITQVEFFGLGERENIMKNWIEVREGNGGACGYPKRIGLKAPVLLPQFGRDGGSPRWQVTFEVDNHPFTLKTQIAFERVCFQFNCGAAVIRPGSGSYAPFSEFALDHDHTLNVSGHARGWG